MASTMGQADSNRLMIVKNSILFVCFWQLAVAVSAQPRDLKFTSLTSRDGLLSNSVNAILKDRYGLMWFATDDGLNKFDGTNFTVYRHKPGDPFSLRSNEILALHEDGSGHLWVGTSGGALSFYDREKDRFINYPAGISAEGLSPNGVIRSICSDYTGVIWIAQFESPYILDPATSHTTRIDIARGSPLSKISPYCVFEDSRHQMWVGTDKGLFLYIRATQSFRRFSHDSSDPSSLANDNAKALAEDKSGNLWIATDRGLCMMRPDASGFVSYRQMNGADTVLAGHEINAVAVDKDGILWIGTGQGLHVMDPRTGHSATYMPEYGNMQSLTSRAIKCIYIDKEGIYWFGSYRGGINKYDKNLNLFSVKRNDAFRESGSGSSIVTSFAERRDGKVFVGTDGGGLYMFDRTTEQLQRINIRPKAEESSTLTVLALKMTSKGRLYIGTYANGLIVLDTATGKTQHLTRGHGLGDLNANDIFCLMEDSKGAIWAGTNGAGINVLKDNKVIAKFSPNPVAANEIMLPVNGYIRAIVEDAEGDIWIGSHGGGIAVYNPRTGRFTLFNKDNSTLPADKVQALMRDSRGQMWIGTYGGGLSLFDPKNKGFINFSEKDGLQNTTIYQVVEDTQGRIWVSTNTGISSLDIRSRIFRNYNHSNGIQNNNPVHASGICLPDGELFFGGLQGFNYFNPANLTTNRNVPAVIITDLKVANKSVSPGDDSPIREQISVSKEIRLAYKQNFALSFVALNYTIPKQNHYAYKLEGFDKDWNYTGSINTAYYTNLDPGTYIFRVKASNNDGVWSSADTSLKIYVKPPFWRTIYAYLFYILAAGGLLFYSRHRGMTRLRKKFELEREKQEASRVQELDRLKLKFLTNLSHEFRTPISLIMGPVEQLLSGQRQENAVDKLHMIQRNGRRLLNLVNQLLDFRKMEEQELKLQLSEEELVAFVKDVSHSFTDLSERKKIQFTVESEIPALYVFFDRDKIERILFNLLSNAFKFTLEGGSVALVLHELEENAGDGRKWVSIKVKDTGIGMPGETKEKIFDRFFQNDSAAVLNQGTGIGLSITREFVNMHGGTIGVESESGKGSIFTVQLPLMVAKPFLADSPPAILTGEPAVENAERTPEAANNTSGMPDGNTGELPSILLVEDNDDFRFYLKENLRNHYKVIEAADGKEGWQKALSGHPQLIVSDISMPVMDGIALTRKLKADKRTSHIPVILLTALTGDGERMEGLGTGANDYITKPFSFEVLMAKIKNLLELRNTFKTTYTRQIKVLTPEVAFESEDEKLLSRIINELEENIANPHLSVEFLSKQVGMSRSSLYNKLLELTGQTPVEYIRSFKLDKAAVLLEKRDLTIAEVAYLVGFSTPNYFAKAFKAKFNMLPSEYAIRIRKVNQGNDQQG